MNQTRLAYTAKSEIPGTQDPGNLSEANKVDVGGNADDSEGTSTEDGPCDHEDGGHGGNGGIYG